MIEEIDAMGLSKDQVVAIMLTLEFEIALNDVEACRSVLKQAVILKDSVHTSLGLDRQLTTLVALARSARNSARLIELNKSRRES